MTSKVIQGHIRPVLCQNLSSTFFYKPILNANTMKTHFFHKIIYDLKCHFYVIEKFCDNFCPYLGAIEIDNS